MQSPLRCAATLLRNYSRNNVPLRMRYLLRYIFCLLLPLLLSACSSMPDRQKIPTANTEHTIYFIYREWHTSILLDADTVARYSKHLPAESFGNQFVRIGWGDGDYFTGKSKSFGAATKALLASRYSALQVLTYRQPPFSQIPSGTWVPLALTNEGMRGLIRYLDESFALDEQRQIVPLQAYGADIGHFYQSIGNYSVFSNCNTWSGRALQSAQLPVRSSLKLTARSVFEQAQFISSYQQALGLIEKYPAASAK
jgi:uncharacterized protein (TIGR02117 family)